MTDPTGPWASATEIADAVVEGSVRAVAVAEAALARIARGEPGAQRLHRRHRRAGARRGGGGRRGRRGGAAGRAARRRAVRGQEPLRRRRPADAGRVADQPRAGAGGGRRGAGAADGGGRRGAARHAQHGRVRLRLHRRERPRRRLPQPARPGPDERRLVVGLRRGDGGGAGAGLARLGHQRLAAGAGVALRRLQPEADLRPAAADRDLPLRRQPRPSRPVRAHRARPRRSPTTRCRGRTPAIPAARSARPSRRRRGSGRRGDCASACSAAGSTTNAGEEARAAVARVADALEPHAEVGTLRLDEAEAGRAAAYLITNAESADFHLRPAAGARRRLRSRHARPLPRRRAAAGRLGRAGAAGPALVARAGARRLSRASTCWWRRRRPARRRAIGAKTLALAGRDLPLRPSLGLLAQPFSCIGLPVATVPVFGDGPLPIGVQLVARPWREDVCLQAAHLLEQAGAAAACPARCLVASYA